MDPRQYEAAMKESMKKRTGKTLDEWLELLKDSIPREKKGRLKWLKEVHGLGQNSAQLILHQLEHGDSSMFDNTVNLVEQHFQGANAPLRPLFEWFSEQVLNMGNDVRVEPRKGYIGFARKKQFAVVKPGNGVLHVGLALAASPEYPWLQSAKGLGAPARIQTKTVVSDKTDLNEDVRNLLLQAYTQNG